MPSKLRHRGAILRLQIIEVLLDLLEQAAGLLDEENFDDLKAQYRAAMPELTSRESWRKVTSPSKATTRGARQASASRDWVASATPIACATVPSLGRRTPDMQCNKVDLPEPEGPMTATSSPG